MEINELMHMQVQLDKAHGFPVDFSNRQEKYDQLTKDLVGLFGEVGEFSNIVKKINIKLARPNEYELDVDVAEASLRDELIDGLIYILRIGAILDVDLNKAIVEKIEANKARYAKLRRE